MTTREPIPREMLDLFAASPDGQLSTSLTRALRNFLLTPAAADTDTTYKFLHELRDWAVYTGGASSFTMRMLASLIGDNRSFPLPAEPYEAWLQVYGIPG